MNSPLFDIAHRQKMRLAPAVRRAMLVGFLILVGMIALTFSAAAAGSNPSGFPLPRFVSLRAEPINVRVGPGTEYAVAWKFLKPGLPVEIIQEFDTWRKIRDLDGSEGWVHKSLLTGHRTAYVAPWDEQARVPLRARKEPESRVRAWLTSRYLVSVESCDGTWCAVSARNNTGQGRTDYTGYVEQSLLWGVYPDEVFE